MEMLDDAGNPTDPFPRDEHGNVSFPRAVFFQHLIDWNTKLIGVMGFLRHDADIAKSYSQRRAFLRFEDGQVRDSNVHAIHFEISCEQAADLGRKLIEMAEDVERDSSETG